MPATPSSVLEHVLDLTDLILVMSVNPGFGGQSFIYEMLPKIQQAAEWRRTGGLSYRIEVDGGINNQTAVECARAGADTFVAAGTEVEYHVTFLHVTRGIAAAIVPLDDFLRQQGQQAGVVIDRAAQRLHSRLCALRVALQDTAFNVHAHVSVRHG